ncbi:hypothetical protein NE237_027302 [Protea cynaroides]|uniref:Uncharacterized protein n=1 Tax=Protea cynaroides TaxID=273540 RepID=A0A9Q0GQ82_9MAGN|nr:hypothetical protein NE237_027302 [Protea cynaroides]
MLWHNGKGGGGVEGIACSKEQSNCLSDEKDIRTAKDNVHLFLFTMKGEGVEDTACSKEQSNCLSDEKDIRTAKEKELKTLLAQKNNQAASMMEKASELRRILVLICICVIVDLKLGSPSMQYTDEHEAPSDSKIFYSKELKLKMKSEAEEKPRRELRQ